MQSMSNEEYLDSEEFWKNDYDVRFFKVNENGSEWWIVSDKKNGRSVNCTSMLAGFKIANTAMERKLMMELSIDHSNILSKAGDLLGFKCTTSSNRMKYQKYYDGIWHDRDEHYTEDKSVQLIREKRSYTERYYCNKCGEYDLEIMENDDPVLECFKCGGSINKL